MKMGKKEGFAVVIEYPRTVDLGSVVNYDGESIEVTKIVKVEPVTEKAFLVCGIGNKV